MTREEAIKSIQDFMGWFKKDKPIYEALEMAIKALSAEPCEESAREWCKQNGYVMMSEGVYEQDITKAYFEGQNIEPCEDAISRQAVQIELNKCEVIDVRDENDNLVGYYNADTVDSIVRNLPPVTPKQRTGHWIKVDDEEPIAYDCSECVAMVSRRYRFCPDCGEKMGESEDKE